MVPTERSYHKEYSRHVKYQNSSTHCSKVISKVKDFKKWVKLQSQGHRVKNNGTHGKVLLWNIKALILTVQKLWAMLKFQRGGQNYRIAELQSYRMTDRTKTIYLPIFDLGGIKICQWSGFDPEMQSTRTLISTQKSASLPLRYEIYENISPSVYLP